MADLTRFDFHVLRFMKSLDVMAMDAGEVGQYMLLLSESWLIGDACTLPDDPALLARLARVETVSENVLKKFPVGDTEYGIRRRNPVLYGEWTIAEERSLSAAERGRKGNEVRYGGAKLSPKPSQQSRNSEEFADAEGSPKPSQAGSIQSKPNQDGGDFRNLAVRYRKAFRVNLSHGAIQKDSYSKACLEFGEETVLEKFGTWAPENMWIKERRHTNGLRQFYESLPAMIEADAAIQSEEDEKKQTEVNAKDQEQQLLEQIRKDADEKTAQILHDREEEEKRAETFRKSLLGAQ